MNLVLQKDLENLVFPGHFDPKHLKRPISEESNETAYTILKYESKSFGFLSYILANPKVLQVLGRGERIIKKKSEDVLPEMFSFLHHALNQFPHNLHVEYMILQMTN